MVDAFFCGGDGLIECGKTQGYGSNMRKLARIAGLAWLVLLAAGGATLWVAETTVWVSAGSNRGLIFLAFAAALPGLFLYRWGRGPYQPQPTIPTRTLVAKAYPTTAREMGHVMEMKDRPNI